MSPVRSLVALGVVVLVGAGVIALAQEEGPPSPEIPLPTLLPKQFEPTPVAPGELIPPPPVVPPPAVPFEITLPPGSAVPVIEFPEETGAPMLPPPVPSSDLKDEAAPPLPPQAAAAWEEAGQWFERNGPAQAADALAQFLKLAPQSHLAAEALYKLGACHLMAEKKEDAQKAFDRLVRDYPASPWAQLVLKSHFDEKAYAKLMGEVYAAACDKSSPAKARIAVELCQDYIKRFPLSDAKRAELHYRAGLCLLLLGERGQYEQGMQILTQIDKYKEEPWSKLAAIRQGGRAAFADRMDELIDLSGSDDDNVRLFLELSDVHYRDLTGDAKIKCRCYQARCLHEKGDDRYLAILRELIKEHPASAWAADAQFHIAERAYADGRMKKAQELFLKLAVQYPTSPRSARANDWASWIEQQAQCQRELEKVLGATIQRLNQKGLSLAAALTLKSDAVKSAINARLGVQKDRLLIDVGSENFKIFFVKNAAGIWFLAPDQKALYKLKEFPIAMPVLNLAVDPVTRSFSFGLGFSDQGDSGSTVNVSPEAVKFLAAHMLVNAHGTVLDKSLPGGGSRRVIHLEDTTWDPTALYTLEIEAEKDVLCEVRLEIRQGKSPPVRIRLSDLRLADQLPEEFFALPPFPGIPQREMEKIDYFEALSQYMKLFSGLMKELEVDKWYAK